MGDARAKQWVAALDVAITSGNPVTPGKIEAQLLETCRDDFALLTLREFEELDRLRRDRHVCAHPAFVEPAERALDFEGSADLHAQADGGERYGEDDPDLPMFTARRAPERAASPSITLPDPDPDPWAVPSNWAGEEPPF